jgi:flagellar protein FliL
MTVNLRAAGGESRFLKLRFVLLAEAGAEEAVRQKIPVIVDAYQPFVRELRPEDLSGSAAVFRLKEELLVRTTEAAGAGAVRDILIQDLVQQ